MSDDDVITFTISDSESNEKTQFDQSTDVRNMSQKLTKKQVLKFVFLVFLIVFAMFAIINRDITESLFQHFLLWMAKYPAIGALAYIGIYIITAILIIPGAILTLGAGFVYFQLYGIVKSETQIQHCVHVPSCF